MIASLLRNLFCELITREYILHSAKFLDKHYSVLVYFINGSSPLLFVIFYLFYRKNFPLYSTTLRKEKYKDIMNPSWYIAF